MSTSTTALESLDKSWRNINLLNVVYIFLNVSSSITIVLTNKWVYEVNNFKFGTTLTFLHFVCTFIGLVICASLGMFELKRLPVVKVLPLVFSFCGFVVLTNISLQYNSVGFYQLMKTMTTPCIVIVQYFFYNMRFAQRILSSLAIVCVGVIIASVTDVQLNLAGTIYAGLGVLVTSLYQIWAGSKQKELNVNAMQLLYYQAPLSAIVLIFIIPIFDDISLDSPNSIWNYNYTAEAVSSIFATAVLAFFVNLSIFLVIGRTSPVTYNVVGHFKLVFIIVAGFIIFDYPLDPRNLSGCVLAFVGIVLYTHFKLQPETPVESPKAASLEANSPQGEQFNKKLTI